MTAIVCKMIEIHWNDKNSKKRFLISFTWAIFSPRTSLVHNSNYLSTCFFFCPSVHCAANKCHGLLIPLKPFKRKSRPGFLSNNRHTESEEIRRHRKFWCPILITAKNECEWGANCIPSSFQFQFILQGEESTSVLWDFIMICGQSSFSQMSLPNFC